MPISTNLPPLLDSDKPVPVNVAAMIQLLESRNDDFSVRLVDVLRQLSYAVQTIWSILKTVPPEFDDLAVLAPDGSESAYLGPETLRLVMESDPTKAFLATPTSLTMGDSDESISMSAAADQAYAGWTRNGSIEVYIQCDASGTILNLATGGEFRVNGLRVLTDRQGAVTAVAGTAGGTYTGTEQTMINDLKTAVNDLITKLQNHGIIA